MQSKRKALKVAIAAVAVVGGSYLGAMIGVPVLSLAAGSGTDATPSAVTNTVDNVADTVDDVTGGATAPLTDTVDQATNPAPGALNGQVAPAAQPGQPAGPHAVGDCTEKSLSADDEAKVKAAVEKEVPGATIERIETECDGNGVYEAHLTKSDGTHATAYLNDSFEVTSVQEGGPGGPGGPGHGRGAGGPGAPAGQQSPAQPSSNA